MGYCMDMTESDFVIPSDKVEAALEAVQGMGDPTYQRILCRGFAYVDEDFRECESFKEIMREWRWEVRIDNEDDERPKYDEDTGSWIPTTEDPGCVYDIYFSGENMGDDKDLLDTLAPFVKAGSYIQMQGEDGEMWRWVFDGETCKEIRPTITWE